MAARKRTTSPAFQFYPKDFISSSKVQRMTPAERGHYIMLLSHYWLDNGLPDDERRLARLLGVTRAAFRKAWDGPLGECFKAIGGRLCNARLDHERKVQAEFRRKQKERAERGWDRRKDAAIGNAAASPTAGNAPQSAIPNPQSASTAHAVQGGAPLHDRSHRHHAHCGRVCLPAFLFGDFVRRRNHDHADREVRDWALEVEREWGPGGPRAADEPGEALEFWRARYAERWPAAKVVDSKVPEWARKAKA